MAGQYWQVLVQAQEKLARRGRVLDSPGPREQDLGWEQVPLERSGLQYQA